MKKIAAYTALILALTFTLISCSDSPTDSTGNSRIKLYLVDAPAALDSVIIDVLRVEVHSSIDGWVVVNDIPAKYDVLRLTNGSSVVLGDDFLPAGHYTQIRLILGNENYIYEDGVKYDLTVPSGQQTGLKLIHEFTLLPDNLYELYLDFNADKSIHKTGSGKYMLKPTIRVQAVVTSGTISGQVLPVIANPIIWTTSSTDTITTYTDSVGFFKLMCLPEGLYQVNIEPRDTNYLPKVITNVAVFPQQNTNLGVITLDSK